VLRKVGSVYDILMKYSGLRNCLTVLVWCAELCVGCATAFKCVMVICTMMHKESYQLLKFGEADHQQK
jgi:hypothetical protein